MYSLRHALAQKIAADPMLPLWKNEAVQIMKAYKLSAIDYCKAIESEKCDDANEWVSKALGTPLATTPSATKPQKQTPPGPLPLR